MYVSRRIRAKHLFHDSWRMIAILSIWSLAVVYFYEVLGWEFIAMPLVPVTTIGIAVSLYLGFKSTSAYNRWWEARKIWGTIVNDSRSWGNAVHGLIHATGSPPSPEVREELVIRHLAWVNALAHQLRKTTRLRDSRTTRIFDHRLVKDGVEYHYAAESYTRFLSPEEAAEVGGYANPATHILRRQGDRLRELAAEGYLDSYRHVSLNDILNACYASQGKCERIKNTPFPRQVANFGELFTWMFIALLPLALVDVFEISADKHHFTGLLQLEYVLSTVPFTVLIGWIFFIMEKVSDSTEDPFEGGVTDVHISSLCRIIEVDLKQMIGASDVPSKLEAIDGVLY